MESIILIQYGLIHAQYSNLIRLIAIITLVKSVCLVYAMKKAIRILIKYTSVMKNANVERRRYASLCIP